MAEKVILDLPEDLARRIRTSAARSQRTFEDVIVECIERGASEPSVQSLPDDELLALCDLEMGEGQQEQMKELLEKNREGPLNSEERRILDHLMQVYRNGLVRKAHALRESVRRGLRRPLS